MIDGVFVWNAMNGSAKKSPKRKNSTNPNMASSTPFAAVLFAFSKFFSPSDLDKSAFTPTPVPVAVPIMRFCAGNAYDKAANASWLYRATNTLSTTLYSACTSMERIIGTDIDKISRPMGMTPILFSFTGESIQ